MLHSNGHLCLGHCRNHFGAQLEYVSPFLPHFLFLSAFSRILLYVIMNTKEKSTTNDFNKIDLEQDTAAGWCISSAIGVAQDAFLNEPIKIFVISLLIAFCPFIPHVNKL